MWNVYPHRSGFVENNEKSWDVVSPILGKIDRIKALIRIKTNLLVGRSQNIIYPMHQDNDHHESGATTSILYLTTCNGGTVFCDGSIVDSVANRLVTFPSGIKHAGMAPTDAPYKIAINLNYF